MNFMEREKNSSHGYYGEDQDHGDITTTSLTSRGATELDLMDSSPVHHHQPESHISVSSDEREMGGNYFGGTLGLGTGGDTMAMVEREHMFDKVVTPSDVGKLNRLVIPKQHAEKYFPLDSSTNEKGLLLNFEDSNGKSWRFRYSYWNSSQSYVMTKGWSRFVKDKKLNPGDIVSFHRGKGHLAKDRLFIEWRRRPDHPPHPNPNHMPPSFSIHPGHPYYFTPGNNFQGWGSTGPPPPRTFFLREGGDHSYPPGQNAYYRTNTSTSTIATATAYGGNIRGGAIHHHVLNNPNPSRNSVIYFRSAPISPHHQQQVSLEGEMMRFSSSDGLDFGGGVDQEVFLPSVPVVPGKAAAKRLRLFGVNMDCPISDSSEDDDEEHDTIILPSTTVGHHPHTLMVPPHPSNMVQLRLYNKNSNDGSSSPHVLPLHHQMQFHSDYLDHNKGKGVE